MPTTAPRILFVQPFRIPDDSPYLTWSVSGSREERLMNYTELELGRFIDRWEWDIHPGPLATYGDWPVENREEFTRMAGERMDIVLEACRSGEWDGIVLLGGGEPGAHGAREIAKRYSMPLTSCATAQMQVATMLGTRFSVLDLADSHSEYFREVIHGAYMSDRCASIRVLDYPLGRPGHEGDRMLASDKPLALAGEDTGSVRRAVEAATSAVLDDGADVITFGCSGGYWLQPFVRQGLLDAGLDVPVLEGYSCAFAQMSLLLDLGETVSGMTYPPDRPGQVRRRKLI